MSPLTWALIISGICLVCMVIFNDLAQTNTVAREAFLTYAAWAFDCLKIIFGMIIGALTEKFHNKEKEKALRIQQQMKK
jgi:hypothetical protein